MGDTRGLKKNTLTPASEGGAPEEAEEKRYEDMTPDEQRVYLIERLKAAQEEFASLRPAVLSLPEVLGEFTRVKDKPGYYLRPMCLETELRAMELFDLLSDGTRMATARIAVGIAACVLYKANLPEDLREATEKVVGFVRGTVPEEEVFSPVTEAEVGRLFKNTEEMSALVLKPLGLEFTEAQDGGETVPNAPAPTG